MTKPIVMIVDDDEDLLRLLTPVIQSQGYEVTSFTTGKEALAYLEGKPKLALLILDRVLADMDGLEILKFFQSQVSTQVPVLILSVLSAEKDVMQGLQKGAVDYMAKPFSIPILLQKVHKLIPHG